MTRTTLLSIAAGPALFLAILSLAETAHHQAHVRPAPPLIEPLPNGLAKGPRLVATVKVVSFVHRWEPVEQIKPPPPPANLDQPIIRNKSTQKSESRIQSEPAPHRPRDICQRSGGHRVDYRKAGHLYWRCAYPRKG